jgi:2,4-dienoyl-CoA reductase-like NADH-dependent reductase (Old Yellow Enzyme family)
VTIGDSAVDYEYAKAHYHQLNLGDDRVIAGLSNLVEAIHKYGAKASIELDHSGRLVSPGVIDGRTPIGPSAVYSDDAEASVRVQEMDEAMIARVIENFASACDRCLAAGFEMVMLHGGHGQLLSQFVSPLSNKRTDKYGGNLANRARFVVEILEAVRRRVGDKLALEYRISGDELIPEGLHLEEVIEFIKMIQDKIDLVHVSLGIITDPKSGIYTTLPT